MEGSACCLWKDEVLKLIRLYGAEGLRSVLQVCFLAHLIGESWICYSFLCSVDPTAIRLLKFVLINRINVLENQVDTPCYANLG